MIFYVSRFLVLILTALFLISCSIEGIAEKIIPEDVRLDAQVQVNAISNNDMSLIIETFDVDPEDEAVKAQLQSVKDQIIEGPEIRRDIVGANAKTSFSASLGEGSQSQTIYDISYEIEKAEGFMAVTAIYTLKEDGECCQLININTQKFESSPYRAGLEAMKTGLIIAGGIIALLGLFLIVFLVRRSRSKKAHTTA